MENLVKTINEYIYLTENDMDYTHTLFIKKVFKKNDSILLNGSICKEFLFVQKGVIVHFAHNGDTDRVIYFNAENEFLCDYESFLGNKPSKKSFKALEDSVIYSISKDNLALFYKNIKQGERFGRLLMELVFTDTISHIITSFTESAEERYQGFLKKFSHIQQRVPQYYIASFIGVTPQSLSRIRRNVVKK
jgi:CRP-like cAMP-binding protein